MALILVVCRAGFGGLNIAQASAATSVASAAVIDPVNVQTSLEDIPVTVSISGAWVRVVIPLAQPPPAVSSSSLDSNVGDIVASSALDGGPLNLDNFNRATAGDGTVHGDTVSALSLLTPTAGSAGGDRYSITVAFN